MRVEKGKQYAGLYNQTVVKVEKVLKGSKTFIQYRNLVGSKTLQTKTLDQFTALFRSVDE